MKKFILPSVLFVMPSLAISMEKQQVLPEIEYETTSLGGLPDEIKVQITHALVAGTIEEAVKNIQALSVTNKSFNQVINDPSVTKTLLKLLANRFLNGDLIKAAEQLHTYGAKKWLKSEDAKKFVDSHPEIKKQINDKIIRAGLYRDKNLVQELLFLGSPNIYIPRYYNTTLLFEVTFKDFTEIVKLLLDAGADPNLPNQSTGSTPLHAATVGNNPLIVQLLLQAGADPLQEDHEGTTPLDNARRLADPTILKIIEDRLATIKHFSHMGDPY